MNARYVVMLLVLLALVCAPAWGLAEGALFPYYDDVIGLWGFMDIKGQTVFEPEWGYAERFGDGLAVVEKNGKYGYVGTDGKLVYDPVFDDAYRFQEGTARVVIDGQDAVINTVGDGLTGLDEVSDVTVDGMRSYRVNGLHGFAGADIVLEEQWIDVNNFSEGLACVQAPYKDGGKWGFIDVNGNLVFDYEFNEVTAFKGGLAWVERDADAGAAVESGYMDRYGVMTIKDAPEKGVGIGGFKDGLGLCYEDGEGFFYIGLDGKVRIEGPFDFAMPFDQGVTVVRTDGLWGVIDMRGNWVVPAVYDSIMGYDEGMAIVVKDGKGGYANIKGELVIPLIYDLAYPFENGLAVVVQGNEWSYINTTGTKVRSWRLDLVPEGGDEGMSKAEAEPTPEPTGRKMESLFTVEEDDEEYVPLSPKSGPQQVVTFFPYYDEGSGLWGFMDRNGKVVVKPQWEEAFPMSNGLARVKRNGLWGYVNGSGEEEFECVLSKASDFRGGLASIWRDGEPAVMTYYGEIMPDATLFWSPNPEEESLLIIESDGLYGFANCEGAVIQPQWRMVDSFSEWMAAVYQPMDEGGLHGFIDIEGNLVLDYKYVVASPFKDGLAWAHWNDGNKIRRGFMDPTGKMVIEGVPEKGIGLDGFSSGLALCLETDYGYFYLDKTGAVAIKGPFQKAASFVDGLAVVQQGDFWGVIDPSGAWVAECKYDQINEYSEGLAAAKLDGFWGFIDTEGNPVMPFKYDGVSRNFKGGLALVKVGDSRRYVNQYGDEVMGWYNPADVKQPEATPTPTPTQEPEEDEEFEDMFETDFASCVLDGKTYYRTNFEPIGRGGKGALVAHIQQQLSDWGYLSGKIDGVFGSATEAAITKFQAQIGLEETGKLDYPTLWEMAQDCC